MMKDNFSNINFIRNLMNNPMQINDNMEMGISPIMGRFDNNMMNQISPITERFKYANLVIIFLK